MGWRDIPALRKALSSHSVNGYPVAVPYFKDGGFIVGEGSRVHGFLTYRVRPVNPIPFEEFANDMHWSDKKGNLAGWIEEIKRTTGTDQPLKYLPEVIQDELESGGVVSKRDVQRVWLSIQGCLDDQYNVICHDFSASEIRIPADMLRPGMVVEFHDAKMSKGFPGRIVDVKGAGKDAIVYMESFDPVPFMDAPEAMSPEHIRTGFYSNQTFKIGYGTHEAFHKTKPKTPLPPGKPQNDPDSRRPFPHYILNDPIPLADIETFCRGYCNEEIYKDEDKRQEALRYCVWQCMILYIIPIHPEAVSGEHQGGTFAPLPTDLARAAGEIEVDAEDLRGG